MSDKQFKNILDVTKYSHRDKFVSVTKYSHRDEFVSDNEYIELKSYDNDVELDNNDICWTNVGFFGYPGVSAYKFKNKSDFYKTLDKLNIIIFEWHEFYESYKLPKYSKYNCLNVYFHYIDPLLDKYYIIESDMETDEIIPLLN